MIKRIFRTLTFICIFFSSLSTANAAGTFSKTFTTSSLSGLEVELSGTVETVSTTTGTWLLTAGGVSASSHYARLKYKLPELAGIAPTTFYMKSVVVLPADFYSRQTAGFRIMNIGNSSTTLNGVPVGSSSSTVMFTGLYFNSDHYLRVSTQYGSDAPSYLFNLGYQLPTGQHTLELYGDVANVAPWYFRLDGQVLASGTARLSADTVPVSERAVTRMVTGIDGAAGLTNNSMSVQINSFEIADHDPYANPLTSPSPSVSPSPSPSVKPGDANGDSKVDGIDYVVWLNHYRQATTKGPLDADYDHSGIVDGVDYVLWLNNYGR